MEEQLPPRGARIAARVIKDYVEPLAYLFDAEPVDHGLVKQHLDCEAIDPKGFFDNLFVAADLRLVLQKRKGLADDLESPEQRVLVLEHGHKIVHEAVL